MNLEWLFRLSCKKLLNRRKGTAVSLQKDRVHFGSDDTVFEDKLRPNSDSRPVVATLRISYNRRKSEHLKHHKKTISKKVSHIEVVDISKKLILNNQMQQRRLVQRQKEFLQQASLGENPLL
ncbi:hypothetical protein FGM00_11250 [Aggregatimonas sangjinii]|uniref:Uncharacterized protein n=1 Tax=Aggregatimonas sangjinii TaxID=2583587 RepID=A0A5B7SU80_9FLAO|nr:hypothetical protein [Aggregatimonas sangjinii]QCX00653.1 hypothetical protein FGM00_11250 [Aggregatimonas sangjinii]